MRTCRGGESKGSLRLKMIHTVNLFDNCLYQTCMHRSDFLTTSPVFAMYLSFLFNSFYANKMK